MCNPIAVVATLAGAVVGKKAGENKQKKKQQDEQEKIKKSEDMDKSTVSNPLIPDTFQARVRIGETRDFKASNRSSRKSSGSVLGSGLGKEIGNFLNDNPFLGGRR
jgi:hypothetical protein